MPAQSFRESCGRPHVLTSKTAPASTCSVKSYWAASGVSMSERARSGEYCCASSSVVVPVLSASGTSSLGRKSTLSGRALLESKKKRFVASHCSTMRASAWFERVSRYASGFPKQHKERKGSTRLVQAARQRATERVELCERGRGSSGGERDGEFGEHGVERGGGQGAKRTEQLRASLEGLLGSVGQARAIQAQAGGCRSEEQEEDLRAGVPSEQSRSQQLPPTRVSQETSRPARARAG